MAATLKYNFCIFSLIFRKKVSMVLLIKQFKDHVWVIIYFADKFTVSSIYSYNTTAKVAVINGKWVQNSRLVVISYLAYF